MKELVDSILFKWAGWKAADYLVYNPKNGIIMVYRGVGLSSDGGHSAFVRVRRSLVPFKDSVAPKSKFRNKAAFYHYADLIAARLDCRVRENFPMFSHVDMITGWRCRLG